jgi:pimeloyl-ACP methyl ester carboxylesterase
VNYKNDNRAPLLFITGSEDHIMPPSVQHSNAKHYKSNTTTEVHDFEGRSHWTCGEPGWEAIADDALEWAVEHATGGGARAAEPAGVD